MGMSGMYGASDEAESVATIHRALEQGVTLLDTGDFYGMGHNELLIRRALADRTERPLLSVKFGALRGPDGSWFGNDNRPAAVKTFAAYSLKRLGVPVIDVYRPARLDPAVPIEETIGAIADLIRAGYVRYIGLSEVGAGTIRRAAAVHPIVDLQIEYSVASRGPEAEDLPGARRARHQRHALRRAVARPAHREQAHRSGRLPSLLAALERRPPREQRGRGGAHALVRDRAGDDLCAARHRVGAGQAADAPADHRRPYEEADRRGARRARQGASRRRTCRRSRPS